ncbi:MAG: carbohydrate ABC transporter permease, partial [Gaiellaceae bacterium]
MLLVVAEHSVLIGGALLFLLPFVFIALTSLMTNDQALTTRLWPEPFQWRNYYDVFDQAPLLRWLGNTLVYTVLATLGLLVS